MLFPSPGPVGLQFVGQLGAHGFANRVDALRVDHVELLGDVGLGGQGEHQLLERRVKLRVPQHLAHGLHECGLQGFFGSSAFLVCATSYCIDSKAQCQALARFPAVERIAVVGQQGQQFGITVGAVQHHRGAETAQQRGHWCAVQVDEGERQLRLGQHHGTLGGARCGFAGQLQRQGGAVRRQQA
ncbi:hypothetical protein SDC9_200773 [bioreactor metagenome]|uniref:Uncharacterized protein n=1 Tax=bioreactor metagenome TaxID=1076179 RepID=A0A645IRV7_9ZZZZ